MEHILQSFFMSVLSVSSKAALLAVIVGLTCLLLRRWIPAPWRHSLWLLVFIRVMTADNIGEFRWALPSWPEQASEMEGRLRIPPETVSDTVQIVEAVMTPDRSSQELMSPIPPDVVRIPPSAVPGSPVVQAIPALHVPVAPSSKPVPWMLIAAGLWLAGALAWWSCLLAGWLRFRHRVLRTSTPAPAFAEQLLDEARQLAGKKGHIRLRVADKLHTPAICGIWRPVILLPAEAITDLPAEKLRLLLLHEIGHTQRMDVLVQVLTSVLLGLHWFNPLLWFAHRQLRAEAEAATDAWVLKHTGSKESRRYGETLIDLAGRCSWMGWLFFLAPSVIGAAESSSSLRSRIRAIAAYRNTTRWSWIMGLACVCAMIATGMTQAPQEKAELASKNESTSTASSPPKNTETPPQTTTQSESAPTAADLSTPTAQAKSAPTAVDLATPGFLITSENRVVLKAGTFMPMPAPREGMATDEIGGVVVDEDGKMVANAEVHVRLYRRAAGEKNPDSVKSDAQGRWTMKGIPQGRQVSGEINEPMTGKEFKVTASHPDYLSLDLYHHTPSPGPKTADFRNGTAVLIMETGLVMKGRVTDKAGKPVAKAKIRRGFQERNVDDPTTMTDAEGNYELKHARAGDFRMRIEAKDCAVWMGRVEFHESGMQNFTLDPARTLTVRVLDDKGQPIPKAYAVYQGATKEDHGGGSIAWGTVDAEGKYSWAWTPPRNVTVNISHEAYQDKKVAVKESETEVTVTLQPRHRLTLKMVDATTGKAVPDCKVERGQTFVRGGLRGEVETAWPPNPPRKADAQGLLEDTLREKGELVAYRITSPGYTPLISRVMSEADSNTTQELKLQPTKELVVQLQQPDGSPAPGAHVYALLRTTGFVMQSLKDHVPVYDPANSRPLEASLEADAQGACTLPAFSDDTVIIVVHGSGFASAYWKDLPRGTGWKLEPWARAEGMVREAGKPVAGVEYEYQGSMPLPGQHWVSISLKGTSDAQGKIVMPRVFPAAQAHFAEVIRPTAADIGKARDRGSFSQRVQDYEMKVTRSGETTHFDLTPRGDKSWMVLGRFVTESGPIPENRMPRGFLMDKELTANASRSTFNMANLNRDGTFEIGPLTPGEYRLQLWDQDKPNFTLKSPLLVLPEVPHGATTEQRRRDIGDVVLLDNSSKDNLLQVPGGRVRFRVTVTDTDGKPLPGASIKPVAYRVKENSGTNMDAKSAAPDLSEEAVRTDASGVAEIECGAKTRIGHTLTELQLYVLCDGHVGNYAFFARANVKSAVPLRRAGTVIAKITREGKPVDSDRVHITSSKASTDADEGFIREADGTQVNRCLREGPLLVQAAWKSDDGRLLFSKAVPVTVALDKPATCHLELEPGQHLRGRLDAQVPRPVKNARIGVCVLNVLGDVSSPRISWQDWRDVREDGTFEFTSLPPGQIHVGVLAEGWMHTYEPDAWSIVHPLPLTAPLPDEVVIPMARTYSCEVLVLGKDGQPLPGVNVSASPSLNWDGRGNGFLDIHGPRLDQVLDKPVKAASGWDLFLKRWRTYDAVTDAEGRVTISGLPSGVQNFYALTKPWKPGEGFTPMTHGQSDAIGVGKMGKVILRVQK